jgi:DNA-binding PadR family transcriptional regulator
MVLGAVRAHPAHGYAIAEVLAHGLGPALALTKSTVYAALRRFEQRGWVGSEIVQEGNYPEREVYHLLDEGESAYRRLLADGASEGSEVMMPMVALLAHVDDLPASDRGELLERLRAARTAQMERLQGLAGHEGAAGLSVRLMIDHLRLDVEALDALLHPSSPGRG